MTSSAARGAYLDLDDVQDLKKSYSGMKAYNQSKLADIMFTYELARRLEGTRVTVNCVNPGVIKTNLGRDFKGPFNAVFLFTRLFFAKPETGASRVIFLASSPTVQGVSGKYFSGNKVSRTNAQSNDSLACRRLWEVSAELTNVGAAIAA